ncbi:STAS domain-containing protein [Glaciecola sp. XM2]|jgi:phospholipid transport system transporter-binding protein|uniref:STAS domain-containing protein n=1 Tax=Glaciecola sp. XM2 TaxID=1914931 RepID=UPI001BDDCBC5|nr:STAS domain-containing protein [Glaciecola sp. XM2]MBT1452475.1 STAS domain-containing protein [Glaciecola sp. XM2]
MKVVIKTVDQEVHVDVVGELNRTTLTKNFWDGCDAQQKKSIAGALRVEIDLNKIEHADTSGLAWLLNAIRDIPLENEKISVCNIPQKLLDLAKLSNADELLSPKEKAHDQ